MLARQAFCWGVEPEKRAGTVPTVLYLLAAAGGTTDKQPKTKTSVLSAQRQHRAENAAKAGITGTRWDDNGNETDRSIHSSLLCSPIQFTAFPCLWQKDRQSLRETSNMLPEKVYPELPDVHSRLNYHLHTNIHLDSIATLNRRFKGSILSRDQKIPTPEKYARKRVVLLTHP